MNIEKGKIDFTYETLLSLNREEPSRADSLAAGRVSIYAIFIYIIFWSIPILILYIFDENNNIPP